MRVKQVGAMTIALVLVWSLLVGAQRDQATGYTIYGSGTISCGTWLRDSEAARATGNDLLVRTSRSWLQGFLSGAGWRSEGKARNVPDGAALTKWVDMYCGQHPLDLLAKAGQELVLELEKR